MAQLEEVEGIVLYRRRHRARDFLVKIFTKRFGKVMFFVRGSKKQQTDLMQAVQPFSRATFIADIREGGLSFLRGSKDLETYRELQVDIFRNAYATYICALADAALEDKIMNLEMYYQIENGLNLLNEEYDPEVIMNIIEVKFLRNFGVEPNFIHCSVCGKSEGIFDFSDKYHGILCSEHFFEDLRRLHVNPKAMHLIRLYSVLKLDKIGDISIKPETQQEIKRLIDHIYDESVGLKLKSKKFIDNLHEWEDTLKKD